MMPVFLPPPDESTGEQMERDGWLRLVEQKHRLRLLYAHKYGQHTSPVQGCLTCSNIVGLLCASWYEPRSDVPRGFDGHNSAALGIASEPGL